VALCKLRRFLGALCQRFDQATRSSMMGRRREDGYGFAERASIICLRWLALPTGMCARDLRSSNDAWAGEQTFDTQEDVVTRGVSRDEVLPASVGVPR
jgi:hypothetical protein